MPKRKLSGSKNKSKIVSEAESINKIPNSLDETENTELSRTPTKPVKKVIKKQPRIKESPETVDLEAVSHEGVSSQNVKLDNVKTNNTANPDDIQVESDILPPDRDYVPLVMLLPNTPADPNVFDKDIESGDIELSSNIDYPLFSLGFHHYIHQNKSKMEILKEFEKKKKVYLVMNKFERYVDNYPDDIGNYSEKFFDIGGSTGKPNILSRGFYKLWEILFMFDIIDLNKSDFVSSHLCEGPGSFVQAVMFFRGRYAKKSTKNDKYYAVTLHPEDEGGHVPPLEKSFIEYYEKEKPKRFILHKTYSKQVAGGSKDKDNGDLTDLKTILLFGGQMGKDKANFVTADGGFDWSNENLQEQEAFRLIFAQIVAALKIQAEGGNFVCKLFESFTDTSLKFLYILTQMYDQVYLVKPLMSRPSNSEKYAVCVGFRYKETDTEYKNVMKKLEDILSTLHKRQNENLVKLWSELILPNDFKLAMIYCNTYIANKQYKSINEIVEFIKAQNYYGDVYQLRRQYQIDANKYWISMFFPDDKNAYDKMQQVREMTDVNIQQNSDPKLLPKVAYV